MGGPASNANQAQHDFSHAWFDLHAGLATTEDNLILFSNFKLHDREMQNLLVTAAVTDSDMLQTDGKMLQLYHATDSDSNTVSIEADAG